MNDSLSRYNINISRTTYLSGERSQVETLGKVLGAHYYLVLRPVAEGEPVASHVEPYFYIQAINFSQNAELQEVTAKFSNLSSQLSHFVLYVYHPQVLSREQLLFAQEIGARYIVSGVRRNDELRDYLKRYCLEISTVGSMAQYEQELELACQAHDRGAITKLIEKLKKLDDSGEQANTILAKAYVYLQDIKRAEIALKRLLQLNPQNLWAANNLGKLYIKSKRGAQGIEVLAKLSHFHELSSERLLVLGDAYAQAGMADEAEKAFLKGDHLAGGKDIRFKDGLVKARIIQRDYQGSLALLGGRPLSPDVIAFLNLRAIMSIRENRFEEGVEYYQYATSGAQNQVVKAKLKFNLGLAFVRHGDLERGQECLKESAALGGREFSRAKGPLEKLAQVIKARQLKQKSQSPQKPELEDLEWESIS